MRPSLRVLALVALVAFTSSTALLALTSAEKAVKLAKLQNAYAAETKANGLDSEKAKAIQVEIAALEKEPVTDVGAGAGGPAGTAASSEKPEEPKPDKPDVHEIPELTRPTSYVRREGVKNPCGPYAISAILQSFGENPDYSSIYDQVTPAGGTIGAGPHEILTYLQGHGHSATERNHGSLDDLARGIDRGERMMMMVNTREPPEIRGSHWVAVKGYRIVNGKRYWTLVDAFWGEGGDFGSGGPYPNGIPEEEFAKRWSDPIGGVLGAGSGFHNYYITVGKEPPGVLQRLRTALYGLNETTPAQVLDSGLRDVTRGWEDTFGGGRTVGQRVGGFFQMVGGGVCKLALNVPSLLVGGLGNILQDAGRGLRGWAADKWQNGGFFGKVAAVGATLLSAVCTGVGWVLSGVSAIASAVLGVAGDIIGGIGDVAGDIIDGIGSLF